MNGRDRPGARNAAEDFTVALDPAPAVAELAALWRDLEARAEASFFLSWDWIGCWLAASGIAPLLLSARRGGTVVALALLHPVRRRRHRVVTSDALMLHQTGDPERDAITIEYNGILADRGCADAATAACIGFLRQSGLPARWDEVLCANVTPEFAAAARQSGIRLREAAPKPTWRVDLEAVRRGGKPYLETLSANTRAQIRRAMRLYQRRGPLAAMPAPEIATAIAYFDALKALHQRHWQSRQQRGAFADPFAERFHRALVAEGVASGSVELVRVAAGDFVIGYVYNFLRRGQVYSYQTGFAYEDDPRLKPGLVSHCLCIERHLRDGAGVYDFMAGDQRYKRNLGSAGPALVDLVLQRPAPMLIAEDALRRLKAALRAPFRRSSIGRR
ncbi:MAG TPA: GNAT family N-acetyltransferase [Stellaceae bacterium]|nr:GNAT family N-acetyltransferase [Stellaceae bacterium]